MTLWSTVHDDAPLDDDGRPVHPDDDRDHRICAHPKSDRTSPTEHGRERDDVPYCTLAAGWGVDGVSAGHCTKHGAQKTRQVGSENPNWKHGLYADIDESEYTEEDLEVLRELETTDEVEILEQLIRIHALRYKRAHENAPVGVVDRIVNPQTGDVRQAISQLESDLSSLGGRLADLIQRYKKITEGEKLDVSSDVDVSGEATLSVEWVTPSDGAGVGGDDER